VNAECVIALEREFLERGSVEGLDTSCVKSIRRQPFITERAELEETLAEQ